MMQDAIHELYVVTVVEYINSDAADPVNFIFDNEEAANSCFRFFSKRDNIKLFMEKEQIYGSFVFAQEENNG